MSMKSTASYCWIGTILRVVVPHDLAMTDLKIKKGMSPASSILPDQTVGMPNVEVVCPHDDLLVRIRFLGQESDVDGIEFVAAHQQAYDELRECLPAPPTAEFEAMEKTFLDEHPDIPRKLMHSVLFFIHGWHHVR